MLEYNLSHSRCHGAHDLKIHPGKTADEYSSGDVAMSKKNKHKTPKVDPRVMARPRLDALFERHARGELDDAGLQSDVQALIAETDLPSVFDALVMRMHGTPETERETLMTLVERLKSREAIDYLWQQVRKPRALTLDAKMTILIILKGMGEDVDISDPGRYFSARDLKPSDLKSAEDLFRAGVRGLARHLRDSRDPAEVEAYMHHIYKMRDTALGGQEILFDMVKNAEESGTDLDADFLYAMAHTTSMEKLQQVAERALDQLASQGVKPITPVILNLGQARFYAAYMTDPQHPWQQNVTIAWERGKGVIQALVFLLDFGVPWRGAIKDMFPTEPLTPEKFQSSLVDRPGQKMDMWMYHVGLARAQATIAAAVEANRKYNIPLPKDFVEFRHLVERWVLHPPAAELAADTTRDELAHLPLTPDRSKQLQMIDLRDLKVMEELGILNPNEELDEEDEAADFESDIDNLHTFDDVLEDVRTTFADVAEGMPWFLSEWVKDYLASLSANPDDLDGLDEELQVVIDKWWDLKDWIEYLVEDAAEFQALDDLRGFHYWEYFTDNTMELDDDGGRSRVETVRDLFAYLAQHGSIPIDLPFLRDLIQMLAQPDTLTPFPRPEPLGGEIALRLPGFGEEGRDEPFTFNEWWMALVLERKFKNNWDKCRREIGKRPDATTKLAILDRLQDRLTQDPDYLDALQDEFTPTPEDYQRAVKWFDREQVSEARAW